MTGTNARHGTRAIRAGLAGYPVSHSLSPQLFTAAARDCGLDCSYELLPCQPADFPRLVTELRGRGFQGINVTTPHKRSAWELADSRSPDAELTGNANLLVFGDDGMHAANTDVPGFREALARFAGFDARSQRALILGCGSVAASVLLALSRLGCRQLTVAGRSSRGRQGFKEVAERCRGAMDVTVVELDSDATLQAIAAAELVVNCTSAGMAGREDESPLGKVIRCRPGLLAMDLIYHPPLTRFMAQLGNCGARTENGLAMLACQASAAFELLSGTSVDAGMLLGSLEEN